MIFESEVLHKRRSFGVTSSGSAVDGSDQFAGDAAGMKVAPGLFVFILDVLKKLMKVHTYNRLLIAVQRPHHQSACTGRLLWYFLRFRADVATC